MYIQLRYSMIPAPVSRAPEEKEWREITCGGVAPSPRCESITCTYRWRGCDGILVYGGSQEGLVYRSDVHFFNIGKCSLILPNLQIYIDGKK
jgi:hypothetical protein